MPGAHCSSSVPQLALPVPDGAPRLQLFFERLLEHLDAQHRIGIHLLELGVLLLQRLETLGVLHVHHSVFLAPTMQRGHRDLLLLAELLLAQVTGIAFTQKQDNFFGLVSLLSVHFCRIWCYQILSLDMDHFFWRRPKWFNFHANQ